jgi:hypothetical protein
MEKSQVERMDGFIHTSVHDATLSLYFVNDQGFLERLLAYAKEKVETEKMEKKTLIKAIQARLNKVRKASIGKTDKGGR